MIHQPDGPRHDHLQDAGESGCWDHEPLPRGKINRGMPRLISVECLRCRHGQKCATGGLLDEEPDDPRDQLDDPDDEESRRRRGIFPMGEL